MDVILLQDVQNLGGVGELVDVKPGYARNWLLPKGFATLASKKNKRELEHQKRQADFMRAKAQALSQELLNKLSSITLKIACRVGEQDKLYGSVTTQDIEQALFEQEKITLDRRKLDLREPIKSLGEHSVVVRLSRDLKATIKVLVVAA